MRKFVRFERTDGGEAWVNPDAVFALVPLGGKSTRIRGAGSFYEVPLPIAEVAARLGIALDGDGAAEPEDSPEVVAFAKKIKEMYGSGWVSKEGVATKYLYSNWTAASGWLCDEDHPRGAISRTPDHAWARGLTTDQDCLELARWLWGLGYRTISVERPAEPEKAPDPAALLAEGKRLRFVRDAESDCRPPWPEVTLELVDSGGAYRVTFWGGEWRRHLLSTGNYSDWNAKANAITRGVDLAHELGYRFDSVISD